MCSNTDPAPDHIYYNMILTNNTSDAIPAKFSQTRTEPILEKADDYYVSVVRFFIPSGSIPIFQFKANSYSVTLSYTYNSIEYLAQAFVENPVYTTYNTETSYDNTQDVYSYKAFIDMINTALENALNRATNGLRALVEAKGGTLTSNAPYLVYDPSNELLTLYADSAFYQQNPVYKPFQTPLNIIYIWFNTNLYKKFPSFPAFYNGSSVNVNPLATFGRNFQLLLSSNGSNMKNVFPIYPISFKIDATNNSIDFKEGAGNLLASIAQSTYTISQLVTAVQAALNSASSGYVVSYNYSTHLLTINNATTFTLLFGTGPNILTSAAPILGFNLVDSTASTSVTAQNTIGSYLAISSTQEYIGLAALNDVRSIAFLTDTIPLVSEQLPFAPVQVGDSVSNAISSDTSSFAQILTDFIPIVQSGPELRSFIQYVPSAEYRLISMNSNQPLRRFDVNIVWVDKLQQNHQVFVPVGDTFSIKLLFRRKTYNNSVSTNYQEKMLELDSITPEQPLDYSNRIRYNNTSKVYHR